MQYLNLSYYLFHLLVFFLSFFFPWSLAWKVFSLYIFLFSPFRPLLLGLLEQLETVLYVAKYQSINQFSWISVAVTWSTAMEDQNFTCKPATYGFMFFLVSCSSWCSNYAVTCFFPLYIIVILIPSLCSSFSF